MIFTYQHGQETYTVNIEANATGGYTVVIGERSYTVSATQLQHGGWLIDLDGEARHTAYTAADKARYVKVDGGGVFVLSPADSRASRRRANTAHGDSQFTAQMPGQVVDVAVSEGDTVTAGQTLVVLEAMKMEIRVSAAADGVVKRVHVKKGDVVDREQLLIEIER